jgi:hypothetical protein
MEKYKEQSTVNCLPRPKLVMPTWVHAVEPSSVWATIGPPLSPLKVERTTYSMQQTILKVEL